MIGVIGDPASDAFQYDLDSLRAGVAKVGENIATFEAEIAIERAAIREWQSWMADPTSSFDANALLNGIEKKEHNVTVLEKAITGERAQREKFRQMIATLEAKQRDAG